jgi:hypothetical protein
VFGTIAACVCALFVTLPKPIEDFAAEGASFIHTEEAVSYVKKLLSAIGSVIRTS